MELDDIDCGASAMGASVFDPVSPSLLFVDQYDAAQPPPTYTTPEEDSAPPGTGGVAPDVAVLPSPVPASPSRCPHCAAMLADMRRSDEYSEAADRWEANWHASARACSGVCTERELCSVHGYPLRVCTESLPSAPHCVLRFEGRWRDASSLSSKRPAPAVEIKVEPPARRARGDGAAPSAAAAAAASSLSAPGSEVQSSPGMGNSPLAYGAGGTGGPCPVPGECCRRIMKLMSCEWAAPASAYLSTLLSDECKGFCRSPYACKVHWCPAWLSQDAGDRTRYRCASPEHARSAVKGRHHADFAYYCAQPDCCNGRWFSRDSSHERTHGKKKHSGGGGGAAAGAAAAGASAPPQPGLGSELLVVDQGVCAAASGAESSSADNVKSVSSSLSAADNQNPVTHSPYLSPQQAQEQQRQALLQHPAAAPAVALPTTYIAVPYMPPRPMEQQGERERPRRSFLCRTVTIRAVSLAALCVALVVFGALAGSVASELNCDAKDDDNIAVFGSYRVYACWNIEDEYNDTNRWHKCAVCSYSHSSPYRHHCDGANLTAEFKWQSDTVPFDIGVVTVRSDDMMLEIDIIDLNPPYEFTGSLDGFVFTLNLVPVSSDALV
eukprot:m51a1_g1302 hypothetical protein (609) ;mRNA; r:199717-201543